MFDNIDRNKSLGETIKTNRRFNRLGIALLIGLSIYLGSQLVGIILTSDLYGPIITGGNVVKMLITESLFLSLSLGGVIVLSKGNLSHFGLVKPIGDIRWGLILGLGIVLGSAATIIIIVTGANGNPNMQGLGIREKILLIWLLASISEEIFVRGLLQSYLNPLYDTKINIGKHNISYPVLFSAVFFGIIHLPLILFGADLITVSTIFLMTLSLGYFAASLREKNGSVIPSIGIHMATNIGGTMVGPIVYAILIGAI